MRRPVRRAWVEMPDRGREQELPKGLVAAAGLRGTESTSTARPALPTLRFLFRRSRSTRTRQSKRKPREWFSCEVVIRKNGRVDSPKVLRGLGHGLEEMAINEIVANWRFRPATLDGRPVDLLATVEVTFNLR